MRTFLEKTANGDLKIVFEIKDLVPNVEYKKEGSVIIPQSALSEAPGRSVEDWIIHSFKGYGFNNSDKITLFQVYNNADRTICELPNPNHEKVKGVFAEEAKKFPIFAINAMEEYLRMYIH